MGSDPSLQLQQIRKGDPEALRVWFEENVDGLYGFVYYRVGNDPQAASDVTQGTFERALEQLDRYDPERGTMAAWLPPKGMSEKASYSANGKDFISYAVSW